MKSTATVERVASRPATRRSILRRYQPWALVVSDAGLTYAAFALAYWIRYTLKLGPAIQARVTFSSYQPIAVMILVIMIPVLFVKGAYRIRISGESINELVMIISSSTITVATIVVVIEMTHLFEYSRGVIVYIWVLLIAFVWLGRALFRLILGYIHRHDIAVRRVLVVGESDAGKMVMQSIMSRPDLGLRPAGFVYQAPTAILRDFGRFRALGTVADVPRLIESGDIDEIVIALPASAHEAVWPILHLCERHGVDLKLIPDLFELSLSRVRVESLGGIPLLDVQEKPLQSLARMTKRGLDIIISSVGLVLSLPLLILLALLIRLDTSGPAFLLQERVGENGRRFKCVKLRTMLTDAENRRDDVDDLNETGGPIFKVREDPRRTRVGRTIRRWSLDELPQLLNVLRGEMSVVGPRPPLPREVALYEPRHLRRLEVKPGITGIWQVSGRSDLPFDEMVMMDVYYVDNWSLVLDLQIMLRTVLPVLARKGAY